ncbi:MAG: hypothetical protein A2V98_15185 [Planctomycetes bacterium RBG_16_64_12]|nr:MAG: hypothetical protein A2V98_15185 [Planctomycetes bacterium RBG_16_64_12]
MAWYSWAPYVPVAERRRRAKKKMEALRKRGVDIQPIAIEGRTIAKTFWGQAWCDHLESFSDFENRLPRGRTYVRNGSVCHLAMTKGKIEAKVSGSEIYSLCIRIKTLQGKKWHAVKHRCAGQIGSLLELLQGNVSDHVMEVVTDRNDGLFPLPGEITFECDCPDWAVMCKHVAAVLYGVGARLDEKPELLFTLRGVNHEELIETDAEAAVSVATRSGKSRRLAADDLSNVFGIDIDADDSGDSAQTTPRKKPKKKADPASRKAKKATTKKAAAKGSTRKLAEKKSATKRGAAKTPARKTAKKTTAKRPGNEAAERKKHGRQTPHSGSHQRGDDVDCRPGR